MSEKKSKIQIEPARGERNAITGYYSQYRVSAALVIGGLRAGNLRWIAVADPQAQRVDDFQIAADNCVHAYQFKWSRYPGNFTFNDLIKGDETSPNLIKQLADGWQQLKKLNPLERVVVHLVTNETMSVSESSNMPVGDPPPEPPHFAAFIEQVWKPAHNTFDSVKIEVPENWKVTWEALRTASGISAEDFELFVRDCELEFGKTLPQAKSTSARDAEIYENDLNLVTEKLFRAVYEPEQIIRLNHDQLLDFLGWRKRFEFRNRHEFPVDEILYQPIEESKKELERALTESESGYIGVLGSPGSGKSTLLTQTLRYFPQRIIRYYAFVPDAQGANLRGESQNFLHDLVGAIENAGFRIGSSLGTNDIGQLKERLYEELQLLHQNFLDTGQKTIILVDGLDHIPREQRPAQSLLKDLPLPDQIPAGVLFVLGSQTDELEDLPTAVQTTIRRPERRIEIKPLDRVAIQNIVGKTALADFLDTEQVTKIEQLSGGHPLALIYLLRQLEEADSPETANDILGQTIPYDGKIEDYYQSFWRGIDQNDELAELLGLIARIRGGIDFNWVQSWTTSGLVRRLQRLFAHLFRIDKNSKWYFFHNSFRLFLVDRTARLRHGEFDAVKDRELHLELAAIYSQASEPHEQWEEVHHLYQAGADDKLLQKASPDFFRDQVLKFRSAVAVRADILLAIRAAGRQRDVISLVRQMLTDAEMAQRENNTERIPIIPTLIALGETTAAIEYLRDGARLRVSPKIALENSIALAESGLRQEGLTVFELSEPLEYLSGTKQLRDLYDRDAHQLLEGWASAATYFKPIDKIIYDIQQISVEKDKFAHYAVADENGELSIEAKAIEEAKAEAEAEINTRKIQINLIYIVGLELIQQRRWEDLETVKSLLASHGNESNEFCFLLQVYSWRFSSTRGDKEHAKQVLSETIKKIDSYNIDDIKRIIIAESLFALFGDEAEARSWLAQVQPLRPPSFSDYRISFSDFRHLLRHVRLLYIFGEKRSAVELIAVPERLQGQAGAYCQRGICIIAEISALGWRGQFLDRASLQHKTFSLLRLFNHSRLSNRDEWSEWYPFVSGIKDEFYEELISAIALHGKEVVQDLADDFAREWKNNRRFWSIETIQRLTIALYKQGTNKEWAVQQFNYLMELIAEEETYSRIEKSAIFAAAWLRLGERERASETLLATLLDSSSTGEKDYQLNDWLKWLHRINRVEPDKAAKRIALFVEAIVELERNGGPAAEAAYDLLEITFDWSPRRAVKLFFWFVERGLVNFNDAVISLLQAAIDKSPQISNIAFSIFRELALPFSDPDAKIIDTIVSQLSERNGKKEATDFVKSILAETQIYALPKVRKTWTRYAAEALIKSKISLSDAGLDEEVLKNDERNSPGSELKLKDDTSLKLSEVLSRCRDIVGLRKLLQEEAGGYFYWNDIVKDLLSSITDPTEIIEIANYFSGSERRASASIVNHAARRLLEFGDEQNAAILARMALALSQQSGWTRHLGGGTKIEAHQLLVQIRGEEARRQALSDLILDLSGDYRVTSSIIRDFDEILPVLTEPVPVKEIWGEIELHISSIFQSPKYEIIDLDKLDFPGNEEDNPVLALNDFISSYIAHPVSILSQAVLFVYLELLLKADEVAEKYIRQLLASSEREQEAIIMIVDAAGNKDTRIIEKFRFELETLARSPNFALRFIAHKMLSKIGISIPLLATTQRGSTLLFNLSLPPGRTVADVWNKKNTIAEERLSSNTKDSYEQLKIVLFELKSIASGINMPLANVVERTAQIAAGLAAQDKWSILGELKMQNLFNGAKIKTNTYRRPHANIARQALFHLVAELFDAGLLTDENLVHWKWILEYYDPVTFFNRPAKRPDFIVSILDWNHHDFVDRQPAEIADQVKLYAENKTIIFGEYSRLKTLDWETPTVVRQSLICSDDFQPKDDEEHFFPSHLLVQIRDYPTVSGGKEAKNVTVVWHWEQMSDSPYAQWLAFNPLLARDLGWKPSKDKLFGWTNANGHLMVWSIFWRDGLFDDQPPHLHNEVGEGWVIVGTPEALNEVKNYFKMQLKQKIRVGRKWQDDGQKHQNSIVFEREVVKNQSND